MRFRSNSRSISENNKKALRSLWLGAVALSLTSFAHAQAPAINAGGVVNAASGDNQGLAPGSIVAIFGTNLATAASSATKIPVATTLGDVVSVTFNNVAAPLFYVSPLQINAQVPWNVLPSGTTTGTASVVVTRSTGASPAQSVPIVAARPGVFTVSQNGIGQAVATDNADGGLASATAVAGFPVAAHPISIGDYLIVWCTGLGAVSPAIATGAAASDGTLRNTAVTPVVTIGGVQAKFVYSVLSPQYVGLYQIGVQVADSTPVGNAEPLQIQLNGVTTSDQVTVAVGAATGVFHTLNPGITIFDPSKSLSLPTVTLSDGTTHPAVGYQSGDFVNGKVLYYPWGVLPGGSDSIAQAISGSFAFGVFLSYNGSPTGFADASNWSFFDMTTLDPAANGFNSAVVIGTNVYMVPRGDHNGEVPALVLYDATKAVTDATAYQFVDLPPRGGSLGATYGWCTGLFDGTYIYYVPNNDAEVGHSGNIIRYDIKTPFSLTGGGFQNFDMATINPDASSFQSGIYDGHRFIYFIPFHNTIVVRYDTQYGTPGTANPAAFTNPAAYTLLDPTQLGTSGLPQVSGQGSVNNLAGFTGATAAWDGAHQNEYLYFVPWATYPTPVPHVQNTVARVRIGTQSGATWSGVDITGAQNGTNAVAGTPNWEIFDLDQLTTNPQWAKNGWTFPAIYTSGPLKGQSMIAGFQGSWINTSSPSPRVGLGANTSQYWVEHDVSHALSDPTGWYVAPVPPEHRNGTFGGAYDAAHQIFYPSPPSAPLIQASGL